MTYASVCLFITSVLFPIQLMLKSPSLTENDPPQKLSERTKRQYAYWKKQLCCLQNYSPHKQSSLEDLPRDIKLEIVKFLDIPSVIRLTQVNLSWRLLILNNQTKTLKPIWEQTLFPSHITHIEVSDWRSVLKERWYVMTGRNLTRYRPKSEKFFHVFLVSAFCGYLVPLLFIFHNLILFKEGIAEHKDTVFNPISAPSWLEIFSCLAFSVVLAVCILVYLRRRLRRDFIRYRQYYDDEDEEPEYGWKFVHGDVYAVPENPDFIAAMIGIGHGLMVTHCVLYIPQVPWVLWFKKPLIDLNLYFELLVSVTPTISVLFASKHFNTIRRVSGSYWLVFLTQWLFSVPLLMLLELISRPSAFSPLFTDVNIPGILFAWLIGLLMSGVFGKIAKPQPWTPPVRTNRIRRLIPEFGYHQSTNVHAVAIAIVASCVIGYLTKFEFSWIFSADSFVKFIPAIVPVGFAIGTVTLVLMDRQLNRENYWWRWPALFSGGCFPFVVLCFWIMWNWQYHVTLDEVVGWTILAAALAVQMGAASYDGADWWLSRLYNNIMLD